MVRAAQASSYYPPAKDALICTCVDLRTCCSAVLIWTSELARLPFGENMGVLSTAVSWKPSMGVRRPVMYVVLSSLIADIYSRRGMTGATNYHLTKQGKAKVRNMPDHGSKGTAKLKITDFPLLEIYSTGSPGRRGLMAT